MFLPIAILERIFPRVNPSLARTPLVTPAHLVAFAILASAPLWVNKVGLYPYLAVEIMVWMIFALGYNLLLGQAGLPSFGHGAFFGVGAYAFGLAQLKLGAGLWGAFAIAILAAALAGALVAAFISHRRGIYYALLTIAFGQVFWFISIKWHSVTGGEDGLLNIKRPPLDLGFAQISLASNEALLYFTLGAFVVVTLFLWRLVHSPYGRVLGAVKQNETRAAFVGLQHLALQMECLHDLVRDRGHRRRRLRDGAAIGLSQRDEPAQLRLRRDDGADRRRPRELLGPGDRRGVLHPRARPARCVHRDVAPLVRPALHGDGDLQARGHRRHVAQALASGGTQRQDDVRSSPRKGLAKRFGDRVVLQDVSFDVAEGEIHGIMGPNGAGKTTCFHVLTGHSHARCRARHVRAASDITGRSRARSRAWASRAPSR